MDGQELEITPEMIEAGFQILSTSGIADDYQEADKLLVKEIFRAMARSALPCICPQDTARITT
jgi:hypothetical protein